MVFNNLHLHSIPHRAKVKILQKMTTACTVASDMNNTIQDDKIRYDLKHLGIVVIILVSILVLTHYLDNKSNILQSAGSVIFKNIKG